MASFFKTPESEVSYGVGAEADRVTNIDPEVGEVQIKRGLKSRHINLIAICGMIGTGLFLSSGNAIAKAGPAGAFLAYIFMGLITAGVSYTSGEISAFLPVTGGFCRHATVFVEPALGIATGWNFWYTMAISAPAELSAAASLVQYWNQSVNIAAWITIFVVAVVVINYSGVGIYGESEVIFGCLKILLIIGLILTGLIIDLGGAPHQPRLGFHYWNHPGAFNEYLVDGATGRFLAFWSILITAAFSYGNIQVVAISGTETRNPRKAIPSATKKTLYRVVLFYVVSIFIVGLIVPYNDPSLGVASGTAGSPFVIAMDRAGIKVLPSIINAVVCTSAFSSGSACVFIASRVLYGLSLEGQAPKILQKCNRFGTPWVSVSVTLIFLPLVYLSCGSTAATVFNWFVNLTTVAGLIGWIVVEATYLRFYYAFKAQGRSRDELPYKGPLQPYTAWAALFCVCLIILFSGFDVFFPGNFSASSFLTVYINIPIFLGMYIIAKFWTRSKVIPLSEVPIARGLQILAEERADKGEMEEERHSTAYTLFRKVF